METINLNSLETFDLNKSSTGGGLGLEFLMNTSVKDKKGGSKQSTNIGLNDISDLEKELNEISGGGGGGGGGMEEFTFEEMGGSNIELSGGGSSSLRNGGQEKTTTWDGYSSKVEEIPIQRGSDGSRLTERQKRQKKMMMIQKLEDWSKRGLIELVANTHYTMDMDFDEIEDEYENALDNKRKKDSIKLQANMLVGCVGFIETANKWVNPFDVDLDGFQEKVTDELGDYDDIFAELFEKYKGGKLAPEVQLLLKLGLTTATIAFTNKLFGGNPDFGNLLKTNPNIVNAIQKEMVDMVSKKPSSLAPTTQPTQLGGGPPPPIETKVNKESTNRPDLAMGRGSVFREQGVDLQTNYDNVNKPRPEMRGPQSTQASQILSQFQFNVPPPQNRANPVMTPTFNISEPPAQQTINKANVTALKEEFKELNISNMDDLSVNSFNITKDDATYDNVSILSGDESYMGSTKTPGKRGRKPKQQSEKNRISIDI